MDDINRHTNNSVPLIPVFSSNKHENNGNSISPKNTLTRTPSNISHSFSLQIPNVARPLTTPIKIDRSSTPNNDNVTIPSTVINRSNNLSPVNSTTNNLSPVN